MTTKIISELTAAAAYIRMSSDQQSDSPERQRRQIEDYAQRNGYRVVRWYQDHGLTGTESKNRANYQQLLADAPSGMFSAVLITEQSRMSREDLFSVFPQWGILRDAGVKIVSCQSGVIDFGSLGGIITALVSQYSAHDEVRKLSNRSVTGKIAKALKGYRIGGTRVYGYDRQIIDASGAVLKQASFRENFKGSPDTHTLLVPSAEVEAVEAVRFMFQFVKNGGTIAGAAADLNRRGVRSFWGNQFSPTAVTTMLMNPCYAGITRVGADARGKFHSIAGDHGVILKENTHEAIVDRETFDIVSNLVANKGIKRDKWKNYLLSGLCRCGHCGRPMSGQRYSQKKKGKEDYYFCPRRHNPDGRRDRVCPVHPSLQGVLLERAVLRAWCDVFMGDEAADQLKTVPTKRQQPSIEHEQLRVVREQIERASQNLTLAKDADEFQIVASGLKTLRKREADLMLAIDRANRKVAELPPDIAGAVAKLKTLRKHLDKWPNIGTPKQQAALLRELIPILRQTIKSIVLRTDIDEKLSAIRGTTVKRRSALVSFNPEHANVPDARIGDDVLADAYYRSYLRLAEHLRKTRKPMTTGEVMRGVKTRGHADTLTGLRCCEAEGLIRRVDDKWIAVM